MSGKDQFRITFFKRPKCCPTIEIWSDWVESARSCSPGPLSFCADCTPEYAEEMRSIKRCEHPYVEFGYDGEPFVSQDFKDVVSEARRQRKKADG